MELTRRDALAALAAGGVAVGGGAILVNRQEGDEDRPVGTKDLDALVSLAAVLYPSDATGIPEFVETYVLGRVRDREEYRLGMADALAELDRHARNWYGDDFVALSENDRDSLLSELGVETAEPEPDGRPPERVRFFLVNELLFAFYASPAGGELVGIENPQGSPGGLDSYQRGSDG